MQNTFTIFLRYWFTQITKHKGTSERLTRLVLPLDMNTPCDSFSPFSLHTICDRSEGCLEPISPFGVARGTGPSTVQDVLWDSFMGRLFYLRSEASHKTVPQYILHLTSYQSLVRFRNG